MHCGRRGSQPDPFRVVATTDFRTARFPGTRKDDIGGRFPGSRLERLRAPSRGKTSVAFDAKPRRSQLREQPQFLLRSLLARWAPPTLTLAQRGCATMRAF